MRWKILVSVSESRVKEREGLVLRMLIFNIRPFKNSKPKETLADALDVKLIRLLPNVHFHPK